MLINVLKLDLGGTNRGSLAIGAPKSNLAVQILINFE